MWNRPAESGPLSTAYEHSERRHLFILIHRAGVWRLSGKPCTETKRCLRAGISWDFFVQPYPFSSPNDTFISHEGEGNLHQTGSVITLAFLNHLTWKSDTLMWSGAPGFWKAAIEPYQVTTFSSLTNKLPSLKVIINSLPIILWITNEIADETHCCKTFCPQTGNFSATDRKGRTMQGLNCPSTAIGREEIYFHLKNNSSYHY